MNEPWIHHYTPESDWQSSEWTAVDGLGADKIMASIFWYSRGIYFIDYFGLGSLERNRKNRLHMKKKKVLFRQDNEPCCRSIYTMAKIQNLHFVLPPYSSYSPDLTSSVKVKL